jgi:precorrin-4/cobalt-precorrin-4 C11-methyltransferase
MNKVFFIGAGPGDPELITLKGSKTLAKCQTVIIAGSLVPQELLQYSPQDVKSYDSSSMTLAEIISAMVEGLKIGDVARLHTGDPSIYGAIQEQMAELDKLSIEYEVIPGVTSLFAAAAALKCELTVPELAQTVIITRYGGRTLVPEDFERVAAVGGTLALYLSAGFLGEIAERLIACGRSKETAVAVVYRASWEDQQIIMGTLADIAQKAANIAQHALVIVGDAVSGALPAMSKLYDPDFIHGYRG